MKTCPYCAEEIQDAAIFCRYCRRDLPKEGEQLPPVQAPPPSIVQRPPPEPAQPTPPASVHAPSTQTQPTGESGPEGRSRRSPLKIGIVAGLVLAVLVAIPRVGGLISFSEQAGDALYFRGLLQDLAFHFFINWVLWALVSAFIVWLWRCSRALLIVLVVFGGGIVLTVAITTGSGALPAIAPPTAIPFSQTPVYPPTPPATIRPTSSPTTRLGCSCPIVAPQLWETAQVDEAMLCLRGQVWNLREVWPGYRFWLVGADNSAGISIWAELPIPQGLEDGVVAEATGWFYSGPHLSVYLDDPGASVFVCPR